MISTMCGRKKEGERDEREGMEGERSEREGVEGRRKG